MLLTCMILSQYGKIHLIDIMNANTSHIKEVNALPFPTMIEIETSGEAVAVADIDRSVHLLGSASRIRFSVPSNPIEFPPVNDSHAQPNWNMSPLNSTGMTFYSQPSISAWPGQLYSKPSSSLKMAEWGMNGWNPLTCHPNQINKASQGIQDTHFIYNKTQ